MTDIRSTIDKCFAVFCVLFWCSSGTHQVLGLTAAASAAAGSTAGCPAGPPLVIRDSSKPVLLLPDTTYQFLAGRFVLATTLTLQQGQSCCVTGSSNGSRTILLPPKPKAAAGNSTAQHSSSCTSN
uniref:Pherophorin domain-containing protein n=1 Tax=Tetradesmus obliquus TaxID=3088 RepID=A0A383W2A6_TETOB|eukprot:jgi/Sobl393_1/6278/SZX70786.1